nr:MAG TPA: hypothetical protein [Caudoviricetes sp.]
MLFLKEIFRNERITFFSSYTLSHSKRTERTNLHFLKKSFKLHS